MLFIGKFTESEVWSCSMCWTEQRDDHPQHELELNSETWRGKRVVGNIPSHDGLVILGLSACDGANVVGWCIDGKGILLVITSVLLIHGNSVMRPARTFQHSRRHPHRSIAVGDFAPKHLGKRCSDLLRRHQLGAGGTIRLSCVSCWPC